MPRKRHTLQTVVELGERGLLALLTKKLTSNWRTRKTRARGLVLGVGDDAAVLKSKGENMVLTADMLVEGVDFDWQWARPADVGHKAAAVNLSDLAAMGARPRCLLLSLALRPQDLVGDVLTLIAATHKTGLRFGAPLVGGDLSATTGPLVVSITAIGEAATKHLLRRHHARRDDRILVSGSLGGAGLALQMLQRGMTPQKNIARRQLRPEPQVHLGRLLAASGLVHSCVDISDGLASDVSHLMPLGLCAKLQVVSLPIANVVRKTALELGLDPHDLALTSGEDFELVLAVSPDHVPRVQQLASRVGVTLTDVGVTRRGAELQLDGAGGMRVSGFEHFRHTKASR